jgi:Fur family peroxide stress response transcriptional regulator
MPKATQKLDSATVEARVAEMIGGLRRGGLRLTPQRVALCRALASSPTHPTAQELFDQLSAHYAALSRATVYNTLETLAEVGLAQSLVVTQGGAMRYDANLERHAHLVCTRCHRVEDYLDEALEAVVDRVAARSGYDLRIPCAFFHGVCARCQKQAAG